MRQTSKHIGSRILAPAPRPREFHVVKPFMIRSALLLIFAAVGIASNAAPLEPERLQIERVLLVVAGVSTPDWSVPAKHIIERSLHVGDTSDEGRLKNLAEFWISPNGRLDRTAEYSLGDTLQKHAVSYSSNGFKVERDLKGKSVFVLCSLDLASKTAELHMMNDPKIAKTLVWKCRWSGDTMTVYVPEVGNAPDVPREQKLTYDKFGNVLTSNVQPIGWQVEADGFIVFESTQNPAGRLNERKILVGGKINQRLSRKYDQRDSQGRPTHGVFSWEKLGPQKNEYGEVKFAVLYE